MFRKIITVVIVFTLQGAVKNYAQDICVPTFNNNTNVVGQTTLNDYMFNKFQSEFFKYFGKTCSQYYDVIKFRVSQEQEVVDIKYNATNPDIQKFIFETLASTKGLWSLSFCDDKRISKEIEMPLYFMFTDPCGSVMKMTYYTDTIPQSIMPLTLDGLKIQLISEDKITLSPIILKGLIIQKSHFIKD